MELSVLLSKMQLDIKNIPATLKAKTVIGLEKPKSKQVAKKKAAAKKKKVTKRSH
jgi:hypothetical protein